MNDHPRFCLSCGTLLPSDADGSDCARCAAVSDAVRSIREAEAGIVRARADMTKYARVRSRAAQDAVASGVAPVELARGLGVTRQRINALLRRDGTP